MPYNPGMSFLRFLMLLALIVWIGGIIFLAFVEAPTAFTPGLLPTRHMAGSIVGRSLGLLHADGNRLRLCLPDLRRCSLPADDRQSTPISPPPSSNRRDARTYHDLAVRHLPEDARPRAQAGVIDSLPLNDPVRMEFNRLHVWSEDFESAVLLLGLIAVFRTAQELH